MKNYNSLVGLSPQVRAVLADVGNSGLPVIRGQWFVVDPYKITDASGDIEGAFSNLTDAYNACVDGRGDGILVLGGGLTSAVCSTYLPKSITWSKSGITVFGVSPDAGYDSRARIATMATVSPGAGVLTYTATTIIRSTGSFVTDGFVVGSKGTITGTSSNSTKLYNITAISTDGKTMTTDAETLNVQSGTYTDTLVPYLVNLITVTAWNNAFYNLQFVNECLSVLALGAVSVTSSRNCFYNCRFNSHANTSRTGQATDYDLTLSASECVFAHCFFGTNSVASGATNGNIVLGVSTTQIGQNFFEDCYVLSWSATTTHGAILITNAETLGGYIVFKNCTFINWNSNPATVMATVVIGATPSRQGILFQNCGSVGYTAISADNDVVWTTGDNAASGAGTLATHI